MKIAYIASSEFGCPQPPHQIQAALWIAAQVIEGMTKRGHQTYYVGAGHSTVSATKIFSMGKAFFDLYVYEDWIKLSSQEKDTTLTNYQMKLHLYLIETLKHLEVDLIHYHTSPPVFMLPFSQYIDKPKVQTIHDPMKPSYKALYDSYRDVSSNHFVSISNAQRRFIPDLPYVATVYNGISVEDYGHGDSPQNQLLFLGRIKKIKGIKDALLSAQSASVPLVVAGRSAQTEREFMETEIEPLMNKGRIKRFGVIGHGDKVSLLQSSKALLFPIHWEEPFGLVMIEAMACGTPVIAYNRGSVPEIVKDGVTGFIIEPDETGNPKSHPPAGGPNSKQIQNSNFKIKKTGIEGLVEAIKRIGEIDRAACRRHVEENFTVEKMVSGYEVVYKKVLAKVSGVSAS